MATTSYTSNYQSNDPTVNEHPQNGDEVHASKPATAPIQPLVQPKINTQQAFLNGFKPATNAVKPAFTVLKTSTLQLATGHPLTYIRVLMQLGYEPLPAFQGKTLFGKEALYHPNAFHYLKYVYHMDGFTGLYRGFGCSLVCKVVCTYTASKVDELLAPNESQESKEETNQTWNKCIRKTIREVQALSWGVLVSHPFHVMALRCMGQFVGREKTYSSINIFQNFKAIYDRQGIGGFFVGLIPRWLLEVSIVLISNTIIHLLRSQLSSLNEMESLFGFLASYIAQTVTYPLSVVSTIAAVNGSGLRVGMLPLMPSYANWQDAYNSLKRAEQLKRGSALFNRAVGGKNGLSTSGR